MNRLVYPLVMLVLMMHTNNALHADLLPKTLPTIVVQVERVTAGQKDSTVLSVPRAALTTVNGIPGVFVVENNQARFRMVRPGKIAARQVTVLSGLFGNESLIVSDLVAVQDGSPVTVSTQKPVDRK